MSFLLIFNVLFAIFPLILFLEKAFIRPLFSWLFLLFCLLHKFTVIFRKLVFFEVCIRKLLVMDGGGGGGGRESGVRLRVI